MAQRSYAVFGVGAVGGFYGAKLAAAGHDVHFLARSDFDHLRQHGLRVESVDGDLHLTDISVHRSADTLPPVDVVLVAIKTTSTTEAPPTVRALAERGATVVAMQNGLGVEAALQSALPEGVVVPVLGAMCFICSNKVGPGYVRHLDYGRVSVGEHRPDGSAAGITEAVAALVDDLKGAGLPAVALDDLELGRWKKLVWNIPYNGLSVTRLAGTDELMRDPETRELVETLMHEVRAGAEACGRHIEPSFVDAMLRDTEQMTPYAPSMRLDYDAGRPMELEYIYERPLAAAEARGVELPEIRKLYTQLRHLDARNRAS